MEARRPCSHASHAMAYKVVEYPHKAVLIVIAKKIDNAYQDEETEAQCEEQPRMRALHILLVVGKTSTTCNKAMIDNE